MRTPRLGAISALALALSFSTMLVPSTAHADRSYGGVVDFTEPTSVFREPNEITERCTTDGSMSPPTPFDSVTYAAAVAGYRTFVLTTAQPEDAAVFIYRNGVCVAGDYQPDNVAEAAFVDVSNIWFAKGDTINVKILIFEGGAWSLKVIQPEPIPGRATGPATGVAKGRVALPKQVNCATHSATAQLLRAARSAKSVTFYAGAKRLVTIKRMAPARKIRLRGIPAHATKLKAVVRLESGRKVTVTRAYNRC